LLDSLAPEAVPEAGPHVHTGSHANSQCARTLLQQFRKEAEDEFGVKKAKSVNLPGRKFDDGTYQFTFKSMQEPKMFDSKGNRIKNVSELRMGSGSTIRVNGEAKAYEAGSTSA
jgi:hypothetical protein